MNVDSKKHFISGGDAGFTLVEVLIGLAIFAIGILAVGSMQFSATKNNTTGNITTQAVMLARDKIEELKAATNVLTLVNGEDENNPIDVDGNPGGIFTRQWTISNPLGGSETRQIQVTVNWNRRGQNRTVALTTITQGGGI